MFVEIGDDDETRKIYVEAERKTTLISKYPIFVSYYYFFLQTISFAIFFACDLIRGHIDTTNYYYLIYI